MYTIFYSWQSDLTAKYNRNFIEECLKKALANVNKSDDYIVELNLDRDTRGEPGTPDIVSTIFKKIANANIFVCDISIINQNNDLRRTPNPNVLLELGYAAAVLGWENIVCIYNTSYGKVEDLPFDIKFRRPILYQYDENNEKNKDGLIKQLEDAIKSSNPELAEDKRVIKKSFQNESSLSLKIAVEKPDYWEFKLCEELLISKLKPINQKYQELENGSLFRKSKIIGNKEFLSFIQIEMRHLSSTVQAMVRIFSEDLIKTMGPPGKPGNALDMLEVLNKFFSLLDNLVEWEIDVKGLIVTDKFTEAQEMFSGMTKLMIEALNTAPERIGNIYRYPDANHKIEIELVLPKKIDKINDIISYYGNHPHLLLQD